MNTPRRSPAPPLRSSAEQRRGDPGKRSGTMAPAELRDPHVLTLEDGAVLLEGHPFRSVVVMGDSVAAGVREPAHGYLDLSMADRLHDALAAGPPDLSFTNLGVTGLKIAEVTATQLDAALERRPDLVVLSAGGNDAFERGFDRDRTASELAHLAGRLSEAGARVVLIGLFDIGGSGLLPEEIGRKMTAKFGVLDEVMHQVAQQVPGCVVSDNRQHPLSQDPSIFSSDLIHCNARGHAVAAATLLRDVHRLAVEESGRAA
jgi:lysophospholipase L1-like esterase